MGQKQLLDLSGHRRIAFRDRGHLYAFTLDRIEQKHWISYFDGIESTSERRGKETVSTFDAITPMTNLVSELAIGAEGYILPEGKTSITEVDNWKELVSPRHWAACGEIIADVSPAYSSDDQGPIALGNDVVTLEAVWNADSSGTMLKFAGLTHYFRIPGFEHVRRYRRDQSRSSIVGGSRTGKTVWRGAQKTLIELYDELVERVEGYAYQGVAVNTGAAQWMDAYHKVTAAQYLFRQEE